MASIEIPNGRLDSDIKAHVALKDNGVAVAWTGLSDIRAFLFSVEQKAISGRFSVAVNPEDAEDLVCDYSADDPQFAGLQRIIVRCVYEGRTKTYDAVLINLVPLTEDLADDQVVIEDPEVDVEIEVTEVSTSLLDEAIQAAFDAAEAALATCGHTPYIGDNGNWYVWDYTENDFADTGKPSRGAQGEQGVQGDQGETGDDGKSIYELAVEHGYEGTEEEFVAEYNAAVQAAEDAASAANTAASGADTAKAAANGAAEAAASAATVADSAATSASAAADAATAAAEAATAAAAEVSGAAEAATAAAALAEEKAGAAADAAEAADAAADAAEDAGDYAKAQGEAAAAEIAAAKGNYDSLNERFEATENAAVYFEPSTDPSDVAYQDELRRTLAVLYQAIDDVRAVIAAQRDSIQDADAAASGANNATAQALGAAELALVNAQAAAAAAQAANNAAVLARGDFPTLAARLENIEATKQENIEDLDTIRAGAAAGATAYQKPASGIPSSALAYAVQQSLGKADTAYQKPGTGVPETDLAEAVQEKMFTFVPNDNPGSLAGN